SVAGKEAVLAGSCSAATLAQVAEFARRHPALKLDPLKLDRDGAVEETLAWAAEHLRSGPVLIYASAPPEEVRAVQQRLGREKAGSMVEQAMAGIARGLALAGV